MLAIQNVAVKWTEGLGSLWTELRVTGSADGAQPTGYPGSRLGVGLSEQSKQATLSGMAVVPVQNDK